MNVFKIALLQIEKKFDKWLLVYLLQKVLETRFWGLSGESNISE